MSLAEIKQRIAAAEAEAGRSAGAARLIAVSKKQPEDRIEAVLAEGHRLFGENRVQEAAGRWPALRERLGEIEVHLLGPLQTNKTRQAMELFQAIHSVDREKLARKIADEAQAAGRCPALFLQVNTGEEPQKAGVLPAEVDGFIAACRGMDLEPAGLMCLPPVDEEPALHFALLKGYAERNGLAGLSMGMSGDFETAVRLGATHVRVGSAIFGARPG
ncbi:MAG: YggS family pyridoxal phosphate-dependent enzyme [Pseudomonadota bacterium]